MEELTTGFERLRKEAPGESESYSVMIISLKTKSEYIPNLIAVCYHNFYLTGLLDYLSNVVFSKTHERPHKAKCWTRENSPT